MAAHAAVAQWVNHCATVASRLFIQWSSLIRFCTACTVSSLFQYLTNWIVPFFIVAKSSIDETIQKCLATCFQGLLCLDTEEVIIYGQQKHIFKHAKQYFPGLLPSSLGFQLFLIAPYSTGASYRSFYPIFNKTFYHLETLLTICRPKKVLSAGSLCGPLVPIPEFECPKRTFMLPQKYHVSISNMLSKLLKYFMEKEN